MRELFHAPTFVSFWNGRGGKCLLMLQISSRIFSSRPELLCFWMLTTGSWSSLYCSFIIQIVLGIECQLSVLCKTFPCLCTYFIVAVERMAVCLKSFPLLLYSESSCPPAMSDGKITVPGHYPNERYSDKLWTVTKQRNNEISVPWVGAKGLILFLLSTGGTH